MPGGERGVAKAVELGVVERHKVRKGEEAIDDGAPGGPEDTLGGPESRIVALAEVGVVVVRDDVEALVFEPAIEREVVRLAVAADGSFTVADHGKHRKIAEPLFHMEHLAHGGGILIVGRVIEHVAKVDDVAVVVFPFVGVFFVTGVAAGIGASIEQAGVGPGARVDVPIRVIREMVGRPVAVAPFEEVVAAILVGIRVGSRQGVSQVGGVDAHLRGDGFLGVHAGFAAEDAAGNLHVRPLGIEVARRQPVPAVVRRETQPVVGRNAATAARAANTHAAIVPQFDAHPIAADEGVVHLGVAPRVVVRQIINQRPFGLRHDKPIVRLGSGIGRVLHLVEGVGGLRERGAVGLARRRRPGARVGGRIAGLHVEFDDRVIRPPGYQGAVNVVACCAVAVQAIVEHARAGEGPWRRDAGVAVE